MKYIFVELLVLIILSVFWIKSIGLKAVENNLIANSSVETVNSNNNNLPDKWHKDFYGNNNRVFSYPVAGQDGDKALKIEIKKYTSGDAKWVFKDVPIKGGQKYEFSDYYQANTKNYLIVRYLYKSGVYRYFDLATLDPASNWTQKKIELTVPNNAVSMTVYHLIKNVGWLTTDNFSLSLLSNSPTSVPTVIPTSAPTNIPTTVPTGDPPTPTIQETITPIETPINTPTVIADPTSVPTESPMITPDPSITDVPPTPTDIPSITSVPSPGPTTDPSITPTDVPTIAPTPIPTMIIPTPTQTPINNLGVIANGDFESTDSSTNLPARWAQGNWGTNTVSFSYPVAGNNSQKAAKVEITSLTDGDAKWYFDDIIVEPNSNYVFKDDYISNVVTRIVAQYKLTDGTYSYQEIGTANSATTWQSNSQNITPPSNAVSMTVFHLVDKVGSLTIDNVSLTKQANPNALPIGIVSLDFDDGWDSTFKNGLPIVNGAGFKSTLYIISRYIGDPLYVTSSDILAAQTAGNEIGAHSKTHPQLPLLTQAQMQDEIAGSRQDLLNLGASPVSSFSYPYGEYNDAAISLVKTAGYQSARTALFQDGGFNDKSTNVDLLKTQSIENSTTLAEIQSWIDTAVKNKTWLILVMHQVDNSGSQYSITPAKLQSIVNYLKTNNVKVVTASEGVSYLRQ